MSLISIHRLRLPNGKSVKSTLDFENYIFDVLLKQRPYTPKELSIALAKSTKSIQRYLNPLKISGKIQKIEGTDKYKIASSNATKSDIQKQKAVETMAEFYETESVKKFMQNNTSKTKLDHASRIGRICTGITFPNFKIHPDNWIHPETTQLITQLFKEKNQSEKLNISQKRLIRQWLLHGLELPLKGMRTELVRLGIDGDKPKPQSSRLHMITEQYQKTKEILKEDEFYFNNFGFSHGTFCRPSTKYTVKVDDLIFYNRTVNFIEVNGEKITNKKLILALKDNFEVKTYTHRACKLEVFENKTGESYTKYIYDQEIANSLEKFTEKRKSNGFKYLFWDKNETEFTFENYDTIVRAQVRKDNIYFKKLFVKVGFKPEDFGDSFRANYALRQFGIQKWRKETAYNYGLIDNMGWKDINTLILWYGQRTAEYFEKEINEIIW